MMDGLFKQILILLALVLLIILLLVGYLIVRATTGLR
jgi:hypothetical protein